MRTTNCNANTAFPKGFTVHLIGNNLNVQLSTDPDALLAKHQAIDAVRQRMQERYNITAAATLEKKKEVSI